MAGKKIDSIQLGSRYVLHEVLGRGGMGAVYLATDRLTGNRVALKHVTTAPADLIFASRGADPSNLHLALAQEFKTLASLRHPNIVSVLDYGFDERRQPYFTMEYVPGAHTIVEVASRKSTAEKIELLVQVLQALVYLHRRNILHRDLKSSNVLVGSDGRVKVLDFGLSLVSQQTAADLTQTTSGTFAYLAPELLEGRRAHRGSDLYAVGVIAYEMFAGCYPYNKSNLGVLAVEILNKQVDLAGLDASLRPVLERLLTKDPAARYRRARDVLDDLCCQCETANLPLGLETAEQRESFLQAASFVGRDAELALLSEALAKSLHDQGSVWLIGGESGVGKTRLCEELRARALVEGALVLRGQALSEGGAPYVVWRDALRHLTLQTELSELEASVLKPLIPDLGQLIGREVAEAPEVDPASAQMRFLSAVQDIFERQTQPVTLILEDLHWASESLAVLARLGRSLGERSLLIIGTYRIEEAPDLPARTGLDLSASQVHLLKLPCLDERAIADLSASMLGEEAGRQERIIRLLQRETEGNVFFVIEVLRALAEEAGQLDRIAYMALPQQVFVEGIEMRRRLRRVPEAARPLLRVAAVAGRELDLGVLQATSAGQAAQGDTGSLEGWLAVCAEALMLEVGERGPQGDRWRFCHDKLREGLLVDIPSEERALLHRQVAETIEQVHPADLSQAALLAYHWREAGDISRETRYLALAGVYALSNGVYKDALPFLERALTQAKQAGLPPLRQAELEDNLAETLNALGQPHAANTHSERVLALLGWHYPTTTSGYLWGILTEILRQIWHWLHMDVLGQPPEATIEPAVMDLAGKCLSRFGVVNLPLLRVLPVSYYALRHVNEADLGGETARSNRAMAYGGMMVLAGGFSLRRIAGFYGRKMELALREGVDRRTKTAIAVMMQAALLGRAKWEQLDTGRESEEAMKSGDLHLPMNFATMTAVALHFQARWDEECKLMSEMAEYCRRQGDLHFAGVCLRMMAEAAFQYGRHAEALALLDECQPELERVGNLSNIIGINGLRAQIHLARGETDLARQYAERTLQVMSVPLVSWVLVGYAGVTDYALTRLEQKRDFHRRWEVTRAMLQMRQFTFVHDVGKPRLAVCECWLAGVAGNHRRAEKIARDGIKLTQKLRMPWEEGLLHYHAGRFMPPDDAARREHLTQALAIFERLGAAYDAERARQVL